MLIISHRGYWGQNVNKNTKDAFKRSFNLGFGTETDIRDHDGTLVISHDPADSDSLLANLFFEIHAAIDPALPLALNVKADGLQRWVKNEFERFRLSNAFVFDMSVPDARGYLSEGIPCFTRHSELEPVPAFYDQAVGVWLDGFDSDWFMETEDVIGRHLAAGKRVCIVSPELHRRPHAECWSRLAEMSYLKDPRLMLCTDFPEEARRLLGG